MTIPKNIQELKDFKLSRENVKDVLSEVATFARLAVSGKPLISVRDGGDGTVSLTEGYFGTKTMVDGLRFENLPGAIEQHMISEDAAVEAFRFMMKRKMLLPANENE